jgi:hypothetical protein
MKMLREIVALNTRSPEAANEEFADVQAFETLARAPVSGWDPYEVWRTRVKDESELADRGSHTG